jgi:hypothetical protein
LYARTDASPVEYRFLKKRRAEATPFHPNAPNPMLILLPSAAKRGNLYHSAARSSAPAAASLARQQKTRHSPGIS